MVFLLGIFPISWIAICLYSAGFLWNRATTFYLERKERNERTKRDAGELPDLHFWEEADLELLRGGKEDKQPRCVYIYTHKGLLLYILASINGNA